MKPRWQIDDEVRLIRNVRDDGTFPGARMGDLLLRRGSVGVIRDIGFFLQDQIIYSVHFHAENRLVGCREEELIDIAEDWTPSRFEFREKVRARITLTVKDEILIRAGEVGEIVKVMHGAPGDANGIVYHVHFDALPGRVLQIPETMLASNEAPRQAPTKTQIKSQMQAPETTSFFVSSFASHFSCPPPAKKPARENPNPNHRS